jgi:hypothetical protein
MPTEPVTLAKVAGWLVERVLKNIWRFMRKLEQISVRVSLLLVLVVFVAITAGGTVILIQSSAERPTPPAPPAGPLTRLPDKVDLGVYCGSPASGNLALGKCRWQIADFNSVCDSQYTATKYPRLARPITMSFSDPLNPSSGQCFSADGQVAGGVDLTAYCNAVLTSRPAGVDYEAVPVDNSNQWICERTLDILAVCITTFQESKLEARIEMGKVICYRRD